MKHKILKIMAVLVLTLPMTIVLAAGHAVAADQMISLASKTLQMSTGRALIELSDRGRRHKVLRLKVRRGKVLLSKVIVVYGDGTRHIEKRRINLLERERTRPINRLKTARSIKTISLVWSKRKSDPRTTVIEVLGLPAAGDVPARDTSKSGSNAGRGSGDKTCKAVVVVSGKASLTKVPGAYLSSLFAWRKAVRDRYGADFQPWRRAAGKNIDCYQGTKNGKSGWICTRSASPCSGNLAKIKEKIKYSPPSRTPPITRTLRPQDQGKDVLILQDRLADNGYDVDVDGKFGPKTTKALRDYQKKNGLSPDGTLGPATLQVLTGEPSTISNAKKTCEKNGTKICTLVRIFFGTDRKRKQIKGRIQYGFERARELQLGRAFVSVPRAAKRKKGQINRPSWLDRWVFRVPKEGDPAKHFTILKDGFRLFTDRGDFLAEVRSHMNRAGKFKDHAFIFVHGFNVSFDAALYRSAQIAYDLGHDEFDKGRIPFGTAFMYSWPSAGEVEDYGYDLDSARFAVDYLRDFVELVTKRSGARQVHIIAHSMGNVALLNALSKISEQQVSGVKINQIILAAPDMDAQRFAELSQKIKPLARNITLYASAKDRAMKVARRLYKDSPRAGDVPSAGPVVVPNVFSVDISALSTAIFSIRHSEYANNRVLLNDMQRMFVDETQPPAARNGNFVLKGTKSLPYWRYAE